MEDSLNCGWIQEAQLVNLKLWQLAWEKTQATYAQAKPIHRRIRTVKSILTIMADDLIRSTETSLRKAGIASLEGVRRHGKKLVHFSPKLRKDADTLQKFLLENVYTVGPNAERASLCRQVLRDLFTLFLENPSLMPTRYQNRIASSGSHRIVCDYLAGMTDRYCLEEHKKYFGGA
jgi:dGTPase